MLLSEIPERTELTPRGLSVALRPYFLLTAAVRSGDLAAFKYEPLLSWNHFLSAPCKQPPVAFFI